jgi:alkylhydroperoxidase family enzyme
MTLRPGELHASFISDLRDSGLDDPGMREAGNIGFHYNLINRVADAFDFPVPAGRQKARLAAMLNLAGKLFKGTHVDPVWTRSSDGILRPTEVDRGREHFLAAEGKTDPELRRAAEAFTAGKRGFPRPGNFSLPSALAPYLGKLALHAYRVTDEDMATLRGAGHSDEAIYEITMAGALGASLVGLEQLFQALYGGIPDPPAPTADPAMDLPGRTAGR